MVVKSLDPEEVPKDRLDDDGLVEEGLEEEEEGGGREELETRPHHGSLEGAEVEQKSRHLAPSAVVLLLVDRPRRGRGRGRSWSRGGRGTGRT